MWSGVGSILIQHWYWQSTDVSTLDLFEWCISIGSFLIF